MRSYVYLHITKFNHVVECMPRWRIGLNVVLPNLSPGLNSMRGRLIFFFFNFYFVFVFCFVLFEVDVVKVMNLFFPFKVAQFLKNIEPCL